MSVLVKICGVSDAAALDAAVESGADMVGLVFFSPSPRHLDYRTASQLSARARGRVERVALTVDASDAELEAIVETVRPDWLQLHGQERPERVAAVRRRFGLPVMKAVSIATAEDVSGAAAYADAADRVLFDARPPRDSTRPGGLGRTFDWRLLDPLRRGAPFFLSGGLSAENVGDALRATNAAGIDVSSGVERAPGKKDANLIRQFVRTVRDAEAAIAPNTLEKVGP